MDAAAPLPAIVPGLYAIAPASDAAGEASPAYAYYLTAADASPSDTITLQSIWDDPALAGWYLFLNCPVAAASAPAFVAASRRSLPPLSTSVPSPRTLVWLDQPDPAAVVAFLPLYQLSAGGPRTPINRRAGAYPFSWAPLSLTIATGTAVVFDAASSTLVLTTKTATNGTIQLFPPGTPSNWYAWYPEDDFAWAVTLPLGGASSGAFQTRLGLDFGTLLAGFGCSIRFAQEGGGATNILDYPFYAPQQPGQTVAGFLIALHPLFPTDAARTGMAFDFGGASPPNPYQTAAATLSAGFLLTTTGGTITLAPVQGLGLPGSLAGSPALAAPGFAFCTTPDLGSSPGATQLYLAPVGTYRVEAIDQPAGSPAPAGPARWMCGLTGLEYLEIEPGDLVALQSPFPARLVDDPAGTAALDDGCTTAWFSFPVAPGGRCYFGQPSASVYFGSVASGDYAAPVDSLLAMPAEPCLFPLAPYGGLAATDSSPAGDLYAAFEARALAGTRHASLTAGSPGPLFLPSARALRATAAAKPATAETKQGFVVTLNDDGSWASVALALSPENPQQILGLTGAGSPSIVPKAIAGELLRDELFLVVSDASALGPFANEIALAGFTFRLDVGTIGPVDENATILIFKYNTKDTLRQLATSSGLWAARDVFVRDLAGTRAQIAVAIATADAGSHPATSANSFGVDSPPADDPFANFRAILDDAGWTGLIALNCAIDGNAMPSDLQMLLGGIDGTLRAHHFGISGNRVEVVDGAAAIARSSLFGVIAYPSSTQPAPPYDATDAFAYELELLTAVFFNSILQDLKTRVGLTVNALFGRAVQLTGGPASPVASPQNTLSIAGRYQLQDGIAVVTFTSDEAFVYDVPVPDGTSRVLRRVVFDRAALVPVASGPVASPVAGSPEPTDVKARFTLDGAIWFSPAPFEQAPKLDLFSFGVEPASAVTNGLAFSGLAVDIAFTLGPDGGIIGKRSVSGDLSAISVAPSAAAIRPNSLLASLPLQLSKLAAPQGGFTAVSIGASPVHVLQLEPSSQAGSQPVVSPVTGPAPPPPNVTVAPQFGLEFDMPLGSLGLLSSATVGLMAKLVIGWGASRLVPETDAAAVLVQLPQVFAGYGGFQLQGILKTVFGDANLLMVELEDGSPVYAVLFNNVQLSILGKSFPSGLVVDFLIFAGAQGQTAAGNDNNLAWFLGAVGAGASPSGAS
ncbi:hypothetical protein [Mangrovicella endophytica]|uniref:hypothetical protein n=1 Tax=Mangrovicella endophytica TaxID=2066697 RepID=UPI000C9E3574|nr:hypothetical protein [Mangrovicella endophytica]